MKAHDYEQAAIEIIFSEIREGTFNTPVDELIKVRGIYLLYKERESFHIIFNNFHRKHGKSGMTNFESHIKGLFVISTSFYWCA